MSLREPSSAEKGAVYASLTALRIGRSLVRQGLLERDPEDSYLAGDDLDAGPMAQRLGASITYRIAVGPHQDRKVFTLQTLPGCEEPFEGRAGKVAGFSLHAGLAARADQHHMLERLRRYISRPDISEQRLSLTPNGNVRYQLKTPYRDGTTHVIFEPLDTHHPAGSPSAEAAGPPHSLSRGICAQQQLPRSGHPGEAWQRQSAHREDGSRRAANAG